MPISEEEIIEYFNRNYTQRWIEYLANKKSIKALWETINDCGIHQSSLSTLYSHHKLKWFTREKYISELVKIQNINKIMATINIKDEYIEKALPEVLRLFEERKRADYNLSYAMWRKKI